MTDIQRYEVLRMDIHPVGRHKPSSVETVVFYADHVEAMRRVRNLVGKFIYTQEQMDEALRQARTEGYEGALYSDDEVGLIKGEAQQRGYRQGQRDALVSERELRLADASNGVGHWIDCPTKRHDVTSVYLAGQRDALAARVLAADDPEPADGSVVLASLGEGFTNTAFQRHGDLWFRAGVDDSHFFYWALSGAVDSLVLIHDAAIKGGGGGHQ